MSTISVCISTLKPKATEMISEAFEKYENIQIAEISSLKELQKYLQKHECNILFSDYAFYDDTIFQLIENSDDQINFDNIYKFLLIPEHLYIPTDKIIEFGFKDTLAEPISSFALDSIIEPLIEELSNPSQESLYERKLNNFIWDKQFDEAFEYISTNPPPIQSFEILYKQAMVNYHLEKLIESRKVLEEALTIKSDSVNALTLISEVLEKLEEYMEAYNYIKKAIDIAPNNEKRLCQAMRLALKAKYFSDAMYFASIVHNLEFNGEEVLTLTIEGLVANGKQINQTKDADKAYVCFELASLLSQKNSKLSHLTKKALSEALKITADPELESVISEYLKDNKLETDEDKFISGMNDYRKENWDLASKKLENLQNNKNYQSHVIPSLVQCNVELKNADKASTLIEKGKELNINNSKFDDIKTRFESLIATVQTEKLKKGFFVVQSTVLDDETVNNINKRNKDGHTALMIASLQGENELVNKLIDHKADVNIRDFRSKTSLMYASENGHTEVIETLLKHGAKIDAKDLEKSTPLSFAIQNNNLDAVKTLISNGANINKKIKGGLTPTMIAARHGNIELVAELLKNRPDLNELDFNEKTAFDHAKTNGNKHIIGLLQTKK